MNIVDWAYSVKATPAIGMIDSLRDDAQRIVDGYLSGKQSYDAARSAFLRLVDDAWINVSEQAWVDGGRDLADLSSSLLTEELSRQRDFARDLFERLKDGKESAISADEDPLSVGANVGDNWASGLHGQYNQTKMLTQEGKRKTLYDWILGATEQHCSTCLELSQGAAHTMDWFISRGYVPGMNGANLECGGWRCDCSLIEASGDDFTLT